MKIICNIRNLNGPMTGVQRYTNELISRFRDNIETIKPNINVTNGYTGHLWEQLILPSKIKDKLLWSPANTGPVFVNNQVVTIHDISPIDHPEWNTRKFSSWYNFITPKLIDNSKIIITGSEFTKKRILNRYKVSSDKIKVTPYGVGINFTDYKNKEVQSITLQNYRLQFKKYVFVLGSLEPRKNINRVLKSWEVISKEIPKDIYLVIAGGMGNPIIFKKMYFDNLPERVILTGRVLDQELPYLYSGALASINISLYEGFGLPALESLACGITPIVSSNSSMSEFTGIHGVYVDPMNLDEIIYAIKETILSKLFNEDKVDTIIERINHSKTYNWDVTYKLTSRILNEVM